MKEFRYIIKDKMGIHARPAGTLVREAAKYSSSIAMIRGDRSSDLKRILSVMSLGVRSGEEILVRVEGSDEEAAAAAVEALLKASL
jgi:phosphocarrier protein